MFNAPSDTPYTNFLRQLHRNVLFDWYMEVGCRNGRGFRWVRGKTIAVDPFFRIENNVINDKPALHVLQQTSDAFFESGFLKAIGARLSFSFLDGMHLMEYLLRDFINTEANSDPKGMIALHDCCPYNHEMTTRDLDNLPDIAWTGDVWKLIPILQKYRPDLEITVLGCKPTGLVIVGNLDPANTVLQDSYDEIVAEWQELELKDYGVERFYDSFDYTPVADVVASGFAFFDAIRLSDDTLNKPQYITP